MIFFLNIAAPTEIYTLSLHDALPISSYGLPIVLALRARRAGRLERGPWQLGRWSTAINVAAVIWIAFITVLFMLPPKDRKSTRLNSSHTVISYVVFCLKKKILQYVSW